MNVIGSPELRDTGQNGSSNQNGCPPSFAAGPSIAAVLDCHDISRRGVSHRSNGPVADANGSARSNHATVYTSQGNELQRHRTTPENGLGRSAHRHDTKFTHAVDDSHQRNARRPAALTHCNDRHDGPARAPVAGGSYIPESAPSPTDDQTHAASKTERLQGATSSLRVTVIDGDRLGIEPRGIPGLHKDRPHLPSQRHRLR
ncbi:hypothetical protein GCM10020369_64590 [Cryptosporangium minutisporangium]|uniref:Uncharacterized protein n=1 Tax=Cryptosporangium minutisporangium TaxID=113569 RepID=A0ABP6T6P5_9ACTN